MALTSGLATRWIGSSIRNLFLTAFAVLAIASSLGGTAWAKPVAATLIVDAATGEVIKASNADVLTYPASLTKMMTLYLLFEALDKGKIALTDNIVFSQYAASRPATNLAVETGATIKVETAILAVVVRSANDVATAVGERLGGSESAFARLMTKKARALGMTQTTFRNASGLPDPGQRTTARDMAILSIALLRDFPGYYAYFAKDKFTYRGVGYAGHNRVMKKMAGADGIKTGYIRASGFNLVSSAERKGRRLVGVVLGGESPNARDNQMIRLMADAFNTRKGTGRKLMVTAPSPATLPEPAESPDLIASKLIAPDMIASVIEEGQGNAVIATPKTSDANLPAALEDAYEDQGDTVASIAELVETDEVPTVSAPDPAGIKANALQPQLKTDKKIKPAAGQIAALPGKQSGNDGDMEALLGSLSPKLKPGTELASATPDSQETENVWRAASPAFGVQVGAYSQYNSAQRAATKAAKIVPGLLADARIVIDEGTNPNGSALYRARVMGITKVDAEAACAKLKSKKTDCMVLRGEDGLAKRD